MSTNSENNDSIYSKIVLKMFWKMELGKEENLHERKKNGIGGWAQDEPRTVNFILSFLLIVHFKLGPCNNAKNKILLKIITSFQIGFRGNDLIVVFIKCAYLSNPNLAFQP